jgi:DNA-binding CsgD family transcriptional regulator
VPAPVASRPGDTRAVGDFLTAAAIEPSALVVEGEPGIGKTTLWLHGVEQARETRVPGVVGAFSGRRVGTGLCLVGRSVQRGRRVRVGGTAGLTPSELRVAELAASGMPNRDVAAELFICPKTVEANLSRIYRSSTSTPAPNSAGTRGRPDEVVPDQVRQLSASTNPSSSSSVLYR